MYIQRNIHGNIIGVSESRSDIFSEVADEHSDEFLTYVKYEACKATETASALETTDTELVRVLEDVIDLLTHKGLIQFTDLPKVAQQKLLTRQTLRENHRSLNLISDEDEDDTLRFI